MKVSKGLLVAILTILLSMAFVQVAFADDAAEGTEGASVEVQSDETADATPAADTTALGDSDGVTVMGGSGSYIYRTDYAPQNNTTNVTVTIPNYDALVAEGKTNQIVVEATMSYNGVTTRDVIVKKKLSEIDSSHSFVMDFNDFGKFTVTTSYYMNSDIVSQFSETVGVTADEYNIAPVSATFPLTLFSLSLWDITKDANGNMVPTIIMLERPDAYNWDELPTGVYALPYMTSDELLRGSTEEQSVVFREHIPYMDAYVHDLYEISPNSKFNFYVVDYFLGLIQSEVYANNIPDSQYTVKLLSDGAFSAQQFQNVYNGTDPAARNDQLVSEWNAARQETETNGYAQKLWSREYCNSYLYAAVAADPNIEWWLGRKDVLTSAGDSNAFGKTAQANTRVIQKSVSGMLTALKAKGDSTVAEFKALYNFSDQYFAQAKKQGKKIMVFLGNRVGDSGEPNFEDYAKFMETFYGTDYLYYYKGHPATPTELYPQKQQQLSELGLTDVNSSIAAELIIFFNPDMYLSGYQSSTWASVSGDMACSLFNMTKATAATKFGSSTSADLKSFVSPIATTTDAAIQALCTTGHSNYLVEFSDSVLATADYTIAIWDATDNVLKYYKLDNGVYSLVKTQEWQGANPDTKPTGPVDEGVYTITCKGTTGETIDIAGGSTDARANVQTYSSNNTPAQRFKLTIGSDGYYTITNVKSGMVLDVQGGGTVKGTNVQQYGSNGSNSQKWSLVDTGDGDGSYYVISKRNGLYLDRAQAGTADGTNIQMWTGNAGDAQKFYFNTTKTMEDGTYVITSALDSGYVVDISGGSIENNANVQLYTANSSQAQEFTFTYNEDYGYYTITNVKSGMALDVQGGVGTSGINVQQHTSNGTYAQMWSLVSDGTNVTINSALNPNLSLDIEKAQVAKRTNIRIWNSNNTNAQKWALEAID